MVERRADSPEALALEDVPIVVTVGAGVGRQEDVKLGYDLAEALGGAAVGASRKAVDLGWMPRQHQVGTTGRVVAPELYVALGVRGAPNHLTGFKKARHAVAVNSDPNAPVFHNCSLGVVGDVHEVVPALVRALREAPVSSERL